jgi:dTDP-glucose 4,6-dehydratase
MTQKTILITGGAGFIGSHFVEQVFKAKPDWRILVLDLLTYAGSLQNIPAEVKNSGRFEFWYGSVTNPDLVSTLVSRSNYIVHFAAESHVARSIYDNLIFYETDVIGTHCLANAVMKHFKQVEKFIHISTSEVYGTAISNPMTEEHPLNPMSPYASAKAGADRLIYSYVQTYKIPALIMRMFNQFGPRQHLEKLIPRVVTSALNNDPVHVHGNGQQTRDWCYVVDTCQNLLKVLDSPKFPELYGEVFNLGTGEQKSVLEICETTLSLMGHNKSEIRKISDRPGNVMAHISSTDKYVKHFEKPIETEFKKALKQTIDWYTNNRERWADQMWLKTIPIRMPDGRVEQH